MAVGAHAGGPADAPAGRPATTLVEVLARGTLDGRPVTKVRFTPRSGRRHQLRVHSAAIGHEIVGDGTYAVDAARAASAPRMMLAAHELAVELDWLRDIPYRSNKGARSWACNRAKATGAGISDLVVVADDPFVETNIKGLRLQ